MIAIPIIFQASVEAEVHRVKETLDSLDWLTRNGYRYILPNGIKDSKGVSVEMIKTSVENDYDLKSYQIAESAILKSWEGNSRLMKEINQKIVGSYMLDEITVILSKYGTQGSYVLPTSMIINIANVPPEFLIKTVIHESLHLMIEDLVKKYSIEHWVKERIVNLIMDLEYKSRFKMQPLPDWALATDVIFKEHYPNLISLMEKASEVAPNE